LGVAAVSTIPQFRNIREAKADDETDDSSPRAQGALAARMTAALARDGF
jgi:hypothetical protein